ncbi:MAG: hypothetical protein KGN01_05315 [Patescibacteria group bacterium]|nr:hypothetical protein [Patescibacteria group bacterium]
MSKYYGRLARRLDKRTLQFAKYTTVSPKVLPEVDNLALVSSRTGIYNYSTLYPMDGNDVIGDCTIAAVAKHITTVNGLVGRVVIPSLGDVVSQYRKMTGGPDTGLNMLDVMNTFRRTGMLGSNILGYVAVNPLNHAHVQQAIQIFGGVLVGMRVTTLTEKQFDMQTPWTPAPFTGELHEIYCPSYTNTHVSGVTWGGVQLGTWAWWDYSVDEVYCPMSIEVETFDNFDYDTAMSDLRALAA